jgi:hypothetical protein
MLDGRLRAIRRATVLLAIAALFGGILVFYLVGGRALVRSHRIALHRASRDGLTDPARHRLPADLEPRASLGIGVLRPGHEPERPARCSASRRSRGRPPTRGYRARPRPSTSPSRSAASTTSTRCACAARCCSSTSPRRRSTSTPTTTGCCARSPRRGSSRAASSWRSRSASAGAPSPCSGASAGCAPRASKVALDDVGTGNAGLEMLREVAGAPEEANARAVLLAMATFACQTGAYVIAEGSRTTPCCTTCGRSTPSRARRRR